jgi:hypothetical protein
MAIHELVWSSADGGGFHEYGPLLLYKTSYGYELHQRQSGITFVISFTDEQVVELAEVILAKEQS